MVQKCGNGPSEWLHVWNFRSAGCSVWRWIVQASSEFWVHGYLDPGGGSCSFWHDVWVPGVRVSSRFPRIAAAAQSLDALLHDVCLLSDRWQWHIPLRFNLRGGALAEWFQLITFLSSLPPTIITAGPAAVCWPLNSSGVFSVCSLRKHLAVQMFPGDSAFPHDSIWFSPVPSKIQCFCWQVFHRKIATIDNLQKRGFQMVNMCVLCRKETESVDHLFIHCEFSYKVWSLVSSTLSIHGPLASNVSCLISAWKGMNCMTSFRKATKAILHSFFWYIWKERND
ncbi:hypothetical protein LINGRAHAP2_LOCUS15726 [Linum grandiflorum]